MHPIPDDVAPIPTEDIVKAVRCETKLGVFNVIKSVLDEAGIAGIDPQLVLEPANFAVIAKRSPILAQKFIAYGSSAIAYEFEFSIEETNRVDAGAAFKLPFTKGLFDLDASGGVAKSRDAKRTFKSQETFADLRKLNCDGFEPRARNPVYPISGSIGMLKVVDTFIKLSELGGGKELFTDTLTFRTTVGGKLNARLTLDPVPKNFRVVSAGATVDAARTDIHRVIVSFAFPQVDLRAVTLDRVRGYSAESIQRASENLCIARAQSREDQFGSLRLYPPEHYCLSRGIGSAAATGTGQVVRAAPGL